MRYTMSFAQLEQDLWVLDHVQGPGFYLEIGAADGVKISNTLLLERQGWTGLSVDPFPTNWNFRRNPVATCAVWDKEADVTFRCAGELGGIDHCIGLHREAVKGCETRTLRTVHIADLLRDHCVPRRIHYMSLDVEGSELDILRAFPWDKHQVELITVEHNFEEPKRSMIRELLLSRGFLLDKELRWDDCFVFQPPSHTPAQLLCTAD